MYNPRKMLTVLKIMAAITQIKEGESLTWGNTLANIGSV
jgi:hypothetical protein